MAWKAQFSDRWQSFRQYIFFCVTVVMISLRRLLAGGRRVWHIRNTNCIVLAIIRCPIGDERNRILYKKNDKRTLSYSKRLILMTFSCASDLCLFLTVIEDKFQFILCGFWMLEKCWRKCVDVPCRGRIAGCWLVLAVLLCCCSVFLRSWLSSLPSIGTGVNRRGRFLCMRIGWCHLSTGCENCPIDHHCPTNRLATIAH